MAALETFPMLNAEADQLHKNGGGSNAGTRRRRKPDSSYAEVPDDNTAAALVTSIAHPNQHSKLPAVAESQRKLISKPRKPRSLTRRAKCLAVDHTWMMPLVIMGIVGSLYAIKPTAENPVHHFVFLSYRLPQPDPSIPAQYGKGPWDIALVAFYMVVLSFAREFVMQEILRPAARYAGLKSRGKQARFMEQMYTAVYFAFLGPAGMYVMSRTPIWYFNTRAMYEDFPHKTHEADFKFYYLFQAAYWAQQAIVLVLGLEKPRKDFKELVLHHIATLALIFLSYRFHFTYAGLAVYITHDISDFFLATSKALNYIRHFLEIPYYVVFVLMWIYLRHYLNIRIILSLFTEFKTVGPYELDWEAEQYKCLLSNIIALGLLSVIQILNLYWLFWVLRVGYRFVVHNVVEDDRSEAEESELEDNEAIWSAAKKN